MLGFGRTSTCIQRIKTAVDDRQHDLIEHLAVALSVPDLLSEVSKKVEPGTLIPSVQWLQLQF